MSLLVLINDLRNTPIRFLPAKIFTTFHLKLLKLISVIKISKRSTKKTRVKSIRFRSFISIDKIEVSDDEMELAMSLFQKVSSNEMEVFGSDWINIGHEIPLTHEGFFQKIDKEFGHKHSDTIKEIIECINLLAPNYEYVNWYKDVISGFSFSKNQHFSKVKTIIDVKDVDVKNVWELGRLQHLTLLLPLLISREEVVKNKVLTVLKCNILDFIVNCPFGIGVHWTSTMEVSIRLLNLTIMRMFISSHESNKDEKFYNILDKSILDHIDFAWTFREHKNGLSNNHYLANLVGLMFGSYAFMNQKRYFQIFKKVSKIFWNELDKQFLNDGGNFESSTCYHVFSTEIAALGLALCFKADKEMALPFNQQAKENTRIKVLKKICRAKNLMELITLPNDEIPQLGDNDSARILLLSYSPEIEKDSKNNRNLLNYRSSLDIISSIFDESVKSSVHSSFVSNLMQGCYTFKIDEVKKQSNYNSILEEPLGFKKSTTYKDGDRSNINLKDGLKYHSFPDFGVYLFKGNNLFLLINGMNRNVLQYWPHGHNDKLSFELWICNNSIVRDPGSLTYTGDPLIRNKYRGVKAHATAIFNNEEQNQYTSDMSGVFRLIPRSRVEVLIEEDYRIVLRLTYGKYQHIREFLIDDKKIIVNDFGNRPFEVNVYPDVPVSYGYGKLKKFS